MEQVVLDVAGDEGPRSLWHSLPEMERYSLPQLFITRGRYGIATREVLAGSTKRLPQSFKDDVDVFRVLRRKHG
jgi:hypothetical protein